MKDNRFIELVNLYIDRQITPDEMDLLEAELQEHPRRRETYRQYCRMHRATTMVYESFRTEKGEALVGSEPIARFESAGRRKTSVGYYAAGLAAACVALVFARMNQVPASGPAVTVAVPAPAAVQSSPAIVQAAPVVVPAAAAEVRPVSAIVQNNPLVAEQDYAAMLAAMRREEQRAFANGRIQPGRSVSLFEDGVFDSQPAGTARAFRNRPGQASGSEFAAFQFQR